MRCPNSKRQVERRNRLILISSAFSFIKALNGLDGAHQYWEGKFTLLGPPVQMLIACGNIITDTHRSNV